MTQRIPGTGVGHKQAAPTELGFSCRILATNRSLLRSLVLLRDAFHKQVALTELGL